LHCSNSERKGWKDLDNETSPSFGEDARFNEAAQLPKSTSRFLLLWTCNEAELLCKSGFVD
jgi:hypothetical protein